MKKRLFKYQRSDFKPLPVTLEHMDISLNFLGENRVEGVNTLRITARESLDQITLDAQDLEVHSVEWIAAGARRLRFAYRRGENRLIVHLPHRVETGATFWIRTRTICRPSDSILDGLYLDTAPPGAPPQYLSQCQQWGFQRILPVFDDCTAKCTMSTRLEADAAYTHLISNGNISRRDNPDGVPVPKPGDPSRQVITYENPVPMAPYLFLVAVGTWDVLEDEVQYPSGRRVKLEYLVPPGRTAGARLPMEILKASVLWQGRTQDYEYRHDVYRTICMEKSNFGGMENTGNTTILTSAALVDEYTTDRRLEYAYGVILHEFEHNQCGSGVTMETPFDMWLNEAFTVDVERQFMRSQFDPDGQRLDEIDAMRAPIGGPLAIEDGGHLGRIVRDGFNDPDEVVDGVTYVKAAEVIRMLRLVIGPGNFRRAMQRYFALYDGGNANTDQFLACFEEAGGRDLAQFKREWLYTIGYPRVEAGYVYDAGERALRISLSQTRTGEGGLFHVPIEIAAVGEDGRDIPGTTCMAELTGPSLELTFQPIPRPAFVSFNRDGSFYGTFVNHSAGRDELIRQIRLDPNTFNRVEAMRALTDIERVRLIEDIGQDVSDEWIDVYRSILSDASLTPGIKARLLTIDEQPINRDYLTCYRERFAARRKLLVTVTNRCGEALRREWTRVDTYAPDAQPRDGVEPRRLKAVLLRTLVEERSEAVFRLAEDHFHRAWNISDRLAALTCLHLAGHPQRRALLDEAFEAWRDHVSAYTAYLQVIGAAADDEVFALIAREEQRDLFRLAHPGHNRALYLPMGSNNGVLWTDRGIRWMTETVIKMAPINANTANRLVASFQHVDRLADDLRPRVRAALEAMIRGVDRKACPSVYGRLAAYLGR